MLAKTCQARNRWNSVWLPYEACISEFLGPNRFPQNKLQLSPSSKLTTHLISVNKHYAIDIADPGSRQDACHGSVVKHRSAEYEGLRFDSSRGLRIFFLCPTLVTRRKNIPLYYLIFLHFHSSGADVYPTLP